MPLTSTMATSAQEAPRRSPRAPVSAGRHKRAARRREALWFALLALPNIALIAIFAYWPVVFNAYLSFHRWDMIAPTPLFVGLNNYASVLTSDDFHQSLVRTAVLTGAVTLVSVTLGLLLALLLNMRLRARNIAKSLVFAPYVVGSAATGTMWLFILDPSYGLSRPVFEAFGASSPHWMSDSSWALTGLIIVEVWRHAGFVAIVYLGALPGIPQEFLEAATLDGANARQRATRVTIPLLMPVTFFLLVITTTSVFRSFDLIAVMTSGGPAESTTTLGWYVYQQAFAYSDTGRSAVAAGAMFLVLMAITAVQSRLLRRKVDYES